MITSKQKQLLTLSSQSGFTIIESLMAVIVVAILMTAIAPAIALSVATRVQARRIELASQAARAYVDGVKAGTITAPFYTVTLSEVNATTKVFTSARSNFAAIAAPTNTTGSLSCTPPITTPATTTNYYCANTTTLSLYCINGDETAGCSSNSVRDLVIQSFRTSNDQNYLMGVRVYRTDGFKTSGAFELGGQQATFTGGLGKPKAPLLQMTTEITSSQPVYQDYCNRLGGCT
ncbi:MAG: hormogonium polysaccharide secretion pseudopilin HpsB [Chroococcus sp. CMT-3BRIN-NPC107]|jgi:prepilin-type N-terminal cleavage/methylation domain-containing protein|nr:hormogonium polysaccharide secretion pseudopilin HpsB [Chroococcus sp. CMT-3BRIN-NPC107]